MVCMLFCVCVCVCVLLLYQRTMYGLPPVHIMCILRWGWCAHSTTTSLKLLLLGTKEISFSYICSNHGRGGLAPCAEPTPRVLTSPAKRGARPQFFMRWHDCMVNDKAMSSLRLDTLGARPAPQSPQLAAKESTMERHGRSEDARGWLHTRRNPPQPG